MNRDEIAAVHALTRSLGWKLLVRDYSDRRKAVIDAVMNPSTDEAVRRQHIEYEAGITDVLGWPARAIAQTDEPTTIYRAGVGPVGEE